MLVYIVLAITAYLVVKILRARSNADAAGYLLVSGLIPLPVYIVGSSADAGIFSIDVCLLAYILAHGGPALHNAFARRALSPSIAALFGFALLASFSGTFNCLFLDPDAVKFYLFTIVKFWEYAFLAVVIFVSRPTPVQLRRIFTILVAGIAIYEILHVLQVSGIVPLSGEQYFGTRAYEFQAQWNSQRAAPFSDRTAWFLTSYRGVIGGTASISAWLSLMAFEAYRGRIRVLAATTGLLSFFSVFATGSREDIAGLVASVVVFAVFAAPRRWKTYAGALLAVAAVYAIWLTCFQPPAQKFTELQRMSALWNPTVRAEGSYADRSHDRKSLANYLLDHPEKLLIGAGPGNFHWYQTEQITRNFFGHNSYVHWTGELGIGGLLLLLGWCFSICLYISSRLRSQDRICRLAARTCLAIVVGRMVTAWGGESLFGTEGMGHYSLYLVAVVYLLASVAWRPQREPSAESRPTLRPARCSAMRPLSQYAISSDGPEIRASSRHE
jgi:hypothetical protein